jgi:hypothetical protein
MHRLRIPERDLALVRWMARPVPRAILWLLIARHAALQRLGWRLYVGKWYAWVDSEARSGTCFCYARSESAARKRLLSKVQYKSPERVLIQIPRE